jgi:UDP-N-acetylglucosamine transferase subunit ALG13
LLKEAFPELPLLNLPGYQVEYAKTKRGLALKIILQVPRILNSIWQENRWLKKAVRRHQIDAVISDNRFGLHHPHIPCIFITHQLCIKVPMGKKAERWLQKINYRYIQRFNACWVPDHKAAPGLAGALSHPDINPGIPITYIGPLSRFQKSASAEVPDQLLVLLSGPEPQRTLLEEKLIAELVHYNGNATLVRGLPGNTSMMPSTNMIRIYNHLPSAALHEELQKAALVICRSGYSTVMDLAAMQKKSILIATPGQTEQEYLALLHQQQQTACTADQSSFSLTAVLKKAGNFSYQAFPLSEKNELSPAISLLLRSLR